MFKIETLLAFVQVAKFGGFTAAAKAQGQTAMALSKQVSGLEAQLGKSLFERTTRTLRLTEFGQVFLAKAKPLLQQHQALDAWVEGLDGKVSGVLNVVAQGVLTYQETVFPFLAEFRKAYPQIELKLDVKEKFIDIDIDQYDVYWGAGDYLGENHPGLKRRLMWQAPFGIFAAPDYLALNGEPHVPEDLAGHQMIGFIQEQPFGALVVKPNTGKVADGEPLPYRILDASLQAAVGHTELAIAGFGLINSLSDNSDIKQAVADGTLVPILEDYWYDSIDLYIYYQQVKYDQPKVRAFIDFMLEKRKLW